jgi:CHAD domain-containing protein
MSAAERAPRGPEQDELLHEVRKDAKRTRYAAEAVEPVLGRDARRYAAAIAELQESLSDFQDGVVTRQVLRELGARASRAGENGFTFGRLHALEQVRAEAAVARWPQARAAVSRRRLRRWFDP